MKHENTRALYRYWNALRGGRAAPFRSELDPRAISPLLDSTFILEHAPETTPRFRLAGTRLCDQFGMELRGMSALALWHGEARSRIRELLARVIAEPCIGHVACTVETRSGELHKAEFLHLPLRSDLGEMTRILGCGQYMFEDDGRGANRPLHHWIDAINVFQIDDVDEASDAPGRFGADALRIDVSRLDDDRPLRRRADRAATVSAMPLRPRLRSIDGGRPMDRLALLRAEAAGRSLEGRERGHLRLVK